MNRHRLIEIICVVFLVCFIFIISGDGSYSDKTVEEVVNAVSTEVNMDVLTSFEKNKVKLAKALTDTSLTLSISPLSLFSYSLRSKYLK